MLEDDKITAADGGHIWCVKLCHFGSLRVDKISCYTVSVHCSGCSFAIDSILSNV